MTLTPSSYKVLHRDSEAPGFKLPGVDGKEHSLEDLKGKRAVLIVFMCNHCPYVQPKFSYLVELQERYREQGLQIVGINANDTSRYPEDSFDRMKEYAERHGFNFPYLLDGDQEVAKAYGAECTPDPFLFDSGFRMKYHGRFDDAHARPHSAGTTSEMEDAIKQVLAGEEVTVESLPSMGCNIKWKGH